MKPKVFIDSDVILDLLAQRRPFYDDAAKIFTQAYKKSIEIHTMAVVFTNVFYILRKINGSKVAREQLKNLRLLVRILPITESITDMALNSKINDFEDGLQYFAAKENGIQAIVTRNIKDYVIKGLTIQTPREYLI